MAYKVLVADDEPIVRKAMQTLFHWEEIGCNLSCLVSNGQEVMEEIKHTKPDILVLDIQMPGISGIEIAKYVWENKLPCKVILLTAYADFSYAQQAVKYDVVDYVIKTGAFEGLTTAIQKAKESLESVDRDCNIDNKEFKKENFFKAIFDGSLYQKEEIKERADEADVHINGRYLVVVSYFFPTEEGNRCDHTNIENFFDMVFENEIVYSLSVSKGIIVAILDRMESVYQGEVQRKCRQVMETMNSFMKMKVYMGVSETAEELLDIRDKYQEAEYAVGKSFFDDESNIYFYTDLTKETKIDLKRIEVIIEELRYFIRKGNTQEALKKLREIVAIQKKQGGPDDIIKEVGIRIYSFCKRILADYDRTVYDLTQYKGSISQKIYMCRHVNIYLEIMEKIVSCTTEYVNTAVSRKNILIYECEKYIEENFERCITVSEISRNIGVSLSYLSRIFKETTGNTIINYINEKKIEKAKEYLSNGDMRIYEIAEKLGFENTTYFSYFFKKYTGKSPKEYKE